MATVQGIAAATSRITVGTGSAELVVSGYLTPHFKGGLWQVNAMRAEALHLVDSLGDVWRDFVVTAITETRRDIGPAGL
ncbi:MAG: phage tail protein [Candidatus Tectomicrobia bacterium]|nr:phage tail protein [Candidatus Tectomicrobia bacterium]